MFGYDYSFCMDKDCPHKDCKRHGSRIPVGVPVSMSDLSVYRDENGECEYFWEDYVRKNLNLVTVDELIAMGVSRNKAAQIIAHREKKGDFRCIEDLSRVRTIGGVTYEKLEKRLYV